MRTRDLFILCGALCLATGASIVMVSQNSFVEAFSPQDAAPAVADDASAARQPTAMAVEAVVGRGEGPVLAAPAEAFVVAATREKVDTSGWTSGIIKGDIQLAVSVLDRLTTMTIAVEEARSAIAADGTFRHPKSFRVPLELGAGTPTFEVRDIPFSEYPYVVSVHAPGLNGGRRTVTIDATTPLVDDIVLAITPGAPFSILVRDQDAGPYQGLEVRMQPFGEPAGRPRSLGTTDNFGSVVFESMLAGDYQIHVSREGQPLGEIQTVTVQPGTRNYGPMIQGQGHTVMIPRGAPVQLQISDPRGYGIADVKVTATAADKIKLTEIAATTDFGGKATFAHLTPGVWHFTTAKDKFQQGFKQVTIKPGQLAELVEMKLVQLRY